jgi:hypothetical protein
MANNITINAYDRRNNVYSITIPFRKYQAPTIELVGVEGQYTYTDNEYIIFGKTTFKFKASSVIGLSKVTYAIDGNVKEIPLNGQKEYEFSVTIE